MNEKIWDCINTWQIVQDGHIVYGRTYAKPKTRRQLMSYAMRWLNEKHMCPAVYDIQFSRWEIWYAGKKLFPSVENKEEL